MNITIIRNKGYYARMRTARIMADETEIGLIKSGEIVNVEIPKHARNIYIKIDWGRSEFYPTSKLKEGETIYLNAWFTFNPLKKLGIMTIPIGFENNPR